jgi:hypothetical protein
VARLQARAPSGSCPWTTFDRDLVHRVLQEHDLPERLATYMPEDRVSEISDVMDGLFGLHPQTWILVRKTADTILHLAELGNVVLIGRGANVVTGALDHAFHVRLVGSLDARIARVQEDERLSQAAASRYVHEKDLGRKRYLKKYYGRDIDDPLLYHLVVNTDRMSHEEAAHMIVEAVAAHPVEPGQVAPHDRPPGRRRLSRRRVSNTLAKAMSIDYRRRSGIVDAPTWRRSHSLSGRFRTRPPDLGSPCSTTRQRPLAPRDDAHARSSIRGWSFGYPFGAVFSTP